MRYLGLAIGLILLAFGVFGFDGRAGRILDPYPPLQGLSSNRQQMEWIAHFVKEYRVTNGRYPSNDEGLIVVTETIRRARADEHRSTDGDTPKWPGFWPGQFDGISVTSLWNEPFIYENRRGLPARKFAGSMVDADKDREYSVRVDDGVYIWCLAAAKLDGVHHSRLAKRTPVRASLIGLGALFVLAYLIPTVRSVDRSQRGFAGYRKALGALAGGVGVGALVFIFLSPVFAHVSCYKMAIMHPPRLREDYEELITKYRDQGVISEKAYQKLLKSVSDLHAIR
jgi:hypothetical protein